MMILKAYGIVTMSRRIKMQSDVFGDARYRYIVLNQHSIVKYGDARRSIYTTISFIAHGSIDYIVGIPLEWTSHHVDEWCMIFINTSSLAIAIGPVMIGVQHLQFISVLKKNTAVTSALAVAFYDIWCRKFNM